MVVISIVSVLLLFSFPMFQNIDFFSNSRGLVGDIVRLTNDLKKRAVEKDLDFIMTVDLDSGLLWVTDETMDNEAIISAKSNGVSFSDEINITSITFAGIKEDTSRVHGIRFRKQGYSDFVLIHMVEGEKKLTLKIEPFLSQIQLINKHVYFDDCI
jgi:hypothetical protein